MCDGISTDPFYGLLDEVKIYGTAKSAAEIAEAYELCPYGGPLTDEIRKEVFEF